MKALFETLAELLQGFLTSKTLWFVVPVAVLASLFLLLYSNGRIINNGTCLAESTDPLGICNFIVRYQELVSLVAVISVVMLIVMLAGWLIGKIRGQLFVEPEEE